MSDITPELLEDIWIEVADAYVVLAPRKPEESCTVVQPIPNNLVRYRPDLLKALEKPAYIERVEQFPEALVRDRRGVVVYDLKKSGMWAVQFVCRPWVEAVKGTGLVKPWV